MAIFDTMKNLFGKSNAEAARQKTNAVLETSVKNDDSNQNEIDFNQTKVAAKRQSATLIIIYQDDHGQSLSTPQIISGYQGEQLNLQFKEFPNYDLVNISGFTSAFVDTYGSITLTYRKHQGADVWMFSQDIDKQQLLMRPAFIRGDIGTRFELTAPRIPDYSLKKAIGPTRGTFSAKQQKVTYYYRKSRWKHVDHNVHYLRVKFYSLSYDEPEGQNVSVTLAPDTVWQTFESIQMINDEWWYNIGGSSWVKFDENKMELLEQNPYKFDEKFLLAPIQEDPELHIPEPIPVSITAIINFVPNKKLALYDRPFGRKINEIDNNSTVLVTARNRVGDMVWFKIDDLGWTIWEYLKF